MTATPTYAQQRVLRLVAELGGSALGTEINDAASLTVGAHLTTLRDAGFLRSRPDPMSGGRTLRWSLTADGRDVVEREASAWRTAAAALERGESA